MLIFTNLNCLTPDIIYNKENIFYNLSSYSENFEKINIFPPFELDRYSREFDIAYEQYINNNDQIFMEFMKILINLYSGYNVIILVTMGNPVFDAITDSLIMLFQNKYDLIPNIVQSLEDWECIEEYSFSDRGIVNLMRDKERYAYIIQAMGLR